MKRRTYLIIALFVVLILAFVLTPVIITGRGDNIHVAAIKGDTARVRLLLRFSPFDAKSRGFHDYTPLHWAAMGGHTEIARMLIVRGADVNALSKEKVSPLYLAAMEGHADVVKLLLKHRADPNLKCDYSAATHGKWYTTNSYSGYAALHVAAENNRVGVVRLLLEHGAAVDIRNKDKQTPLHRAAWSGYKPVVELLLKHGADINAKAEHGHTALSSGENNDVTMLLVSKGIDAKSMRLLYNAAHAGNTDLVRYLLAAGADPNEDFGDGETPLHGAMHACGCSEHKDIPKPEIVTLLINHGAKVNAQNREGETPTAYALERGRDDLVKLLRKHGGVAKSRPPTDIWSAIEKGDVQRVKAMVRANPGAAKLKGEYGRTPLRAAVEKADKEIIRTLLDAGADENFKLDTYSESPLELAVYYGNIDIIELMLSHQTKTNYRGLLPAAAAAGDIKVMKYLLAKSIAVKDLPDKGAYLLCRAAAANKLAMLKYLVAQGADVKGRDNAPVMHALWNSDGDDSALKYLISKGADINATAGYHQSTMLHSVAENPYWPGAAEFLLKHGADPSAVDEMKRTPLDLAQDPETIGAILKYGGKEGKSNSNNGISFVQRMKEFFRRLVP